MSVLHHLAQAAAVLLLLELMVVVIIIGALFGGIGWGLHWVRGKSDWAFGKVNQILPAAQRYVFRGLGWIALPFIKTTAYVEIVRVTLERLKQTVRAHHDGTRRLAPISTAGAPASQLTAFTPIASDSLDDTVPASIPVPRP